MGLSIRHMTLQNFRNYQHFELIPGPTTTVLIGPNAVGKTNCIEAIQLVTALTSFRNPKNNHLLLKDNYPGKVEIDISDGDRQLTLDLIISEGKKEYLLNKKKKNTTALRGLLPAVLFTPDDLSFIKGSQSIKRHALDGLGCQLSASYDSMYKDYEKILRQKNKYLKEHVTHTYLESINEVLAMLGAQLYYFRSRLVTALIPYIQAYYTTIAHHDETVEVTYIPSWFKYQPSLPSRIPLYSKEEAFSNLITCMNTEFQKEHDRRLSLFGPHADALIFTIQNKDAQHFASQGQQRSLVLSYKMAEVAVVKDKLNQYPVLLLDDVMSELDEQRRKELISLIPQETQTFITSTNLGYFPQDFLRQATLYTLEGE